MSYRRLLTVRINPSFDDAARNLPSYLASVVYNIRVFQMHRRSEIILRQGFGLPEHSFSAVQPGVPIIVRYDFVVRKAKSCAARASFLVPIVLLESGEVSEMIDGSFNDALTNQHNLFASLPIMQVYKLIR